MARLKQSTREMGEAVSEQLQALAQDIEPARPFLAKLYRNLAQEIAYISVPDAPFTVLLPKGSRAEVVELNGLRNEADRVIFYPENFNEEAYRKRLVRGMS